MYAVKKNDKPNVSYVHVNEKGGKSYIVMYHSLGRRKAAVDIFELAPLGAPLPRVVDDRKKVVAIREITPWTAKQGLLNSLNMGRTPDTALLAVGAFYPFFLQPVGRA
ncbi:MAG: hypothetical protein WCY41_06235 [Candidatus Micrarchaeia archaeon]